jgi:hypothetical protein
VVEEFDIGGDGRIVDGGRFPGGLWVLGDVVEAVGDGEEDTGRR